LEAIVAAFTLISLAFIFLLRRPEPPASPVQAQASPLASAPVVIQPVEDSTPNLENTRYD
jgi:hypothetical protein